jgi:hypothetical protein
LPEARNAPSIAASNAESVVQVNDFIEFFSAQTLINLLEPRFDAASGVVADQLFTNLSTDFVG